MSMRGSGGSINLQVTVKVSELLEKLHENRARHQEEHAQALAAWREDFARIIAKIDPSQLDEYPAELEELRFECPLSHLGDYDHAIQMFTMCTSEEMTLDSLSFDTFVRDDWDWKDKVKSNSYFRRVIRQQTLPSEPLPLSQRHIGSSLR